MIKARVYEQQWGGFVSDYIQYFATMTEIKELKLRTGWRIYVENKNIY